MKMQNVSPKNLKVGVKVEPNGIPITSFQYVMLDILSNNGDSITTVGNVTYIINSSNIPNIPMTDFVTGSYEVVDYSGYYNTSPLYEPWKAFDNQTGTGNRWLTDNAGSQFVTLNIGSLQNVSDFTEVRLLPGNHNMDDWTTRSIRDFRILVSDDNINFYEILSIPGLNDWQDGVEKSFAIN